ncbi:hypothetical protein [Streptomyces winkii]|uniref:hypothetical protein n=1 Tax=Streptomyces winkii TaxID=3051178 RepID=UPI0028D61373|nr:hypothetical protein [Streptomyces sp. DSM 40971]
MEPFRERFPDPPLVLPASQRGEIVPEQPDVPRWYEIEARFAPDSSPMARAAIRSGGHRSYCHDGFVDLWGQRLPTGFGVSW